MVDPRGPSTNVGVVDAAGESAVVRAERGKTVMVPALIVAVVVVPSRECAS